jgi:hypothetical protein
LRFEKLRALFQKLESETNRLLEEAKRNMAKGDGPGNLDQIISYSQRAKREAKALREAWPQTACNTKRESKRL